MTWVNVSDAHFNRARASLKQAISRYSKQLRLSKRHPQAINLQSALKADLEQISATLDKLDHNVIRIAVFGLVSRGKSAVINALIGQKILQTGPLHGVTRWPRSVYWSPLGKPNQLPTIELIDTPGLDEVGGEIRAGMAQEVAYQADLILFVVSGDITRREYEALVQLQDAHKPLILVFNKTDLYPNTDRQAIYQKLQVLFKQDLGATLPQPILSNDIVMVAAEPAPLQVRIEWPDGRVTHDWESPPPQIHELSQKLITILKREGKSLLALNALRQAREAEAAIAHKTLQIHEDEAEDLIWKCARWKAIAVAANPIAVLDLLGGAAADLVMIRSLARLYGLPMTGYEANRLWNAIVWSSGSLCLGEFGSGLLLGFGKSAAALASVFDSVGGFAAYSTTAIAQASLAGYGSYRVGKAAQIYLKQGCTWGPQGINTIIQDILDQVDSDTVLHNLRREIKYRHPSDQAPE
ncbi:MAG TPA: GTP-binding protein [Elainellaceae cyanobacterium]